MRSKCLVCGQLTDTRRYACLRWVNPGGGVVNLGWNERRVCDVCAAGVPDTLTAQVLELREAKAPEVEAAA